MLTELFCGSMNYRFIHKPLCIDPLCLTAIFDNQYMQNSLYLLVCYFGLVVMTPEIHLLSNINMGFVLILWMLEDVFMTHINKEYKVYHKKYAHGFCFAVLCCGYTLIFPYPSGLLYWHCGNLTIAPVPAKQPWWIWINTSCEFIINDCITKNKAKHNKTLSIFLGIYCTRFDNLLSATIHISPPSFFDSWAWPNVAAISSVHKCGLIMKCTQTGFTHARTHTLKVIIHWNYQ